MTDHSELIARLDKMSDMSSTGNRLEDIALAAAALREQARVLDICYQLAVNRVPELTCADSSIPAIVAVGDMRSTIEGQKDELREQAGELEAAQKRVNDLFTAEAQFYGLPFPKGKGSAVLELVAERDTLANENDRLQAQIDGLKLALRV